MWRNKNRETHYAFGASICPVQLDFVPAQKVLIFVLSCLTYISCLEIVFTPTVKIFFINRRTTYWNWFIDQVYIPEEIPSSSCFFLTLCKPQSTRDEQGNGCSANSMFLAVIVPRMHHCRVGRRHLRGHILRPGMVFIPALQDHRNVLLYTGRQYPFWKEIVHGS